MNKIRWSLAAVCLGVLTACGGGGGGDPAKREDPLSASYTVTLSASTSNGSGVQLDIVDPNKAERLRSVAIDSRFNWLTTLSRQLSANGLVQTQQHEVALYYLWNGAVWAVDLRRGQSTEPRQVSSVNKACRIQWGLDSDTTGSTTWLAILVAGGDGVCGAGNDDDLVLIHSLDSSTTGPRALPFPVSDIVADGRTPGGNLDRLFTVDRMTGQLTQWLLDANGVQPSVVAGGAGNAAGPTLWLGLLPGFTDRGIIQIGTTLHRLSWSGANATLSAALATVPTQEFSQATSDADRLFVVAGHHVLSFSGTGGATTVTTLNPGNGVIREVLSSTGAVWVIQQNTALPEAPSALIRITKSSGAQSVVRQFDVPATLPPTPLLRSSIGIRLVGASGNRLVYSVPSDQNNDQPLALFSVNDQPAASPTLLVARALGIGTRQNAVSGLAPFKETTHVMWCDAGTPSAPVACTAPRFKSYSLISNALTLLGAHVRGTDASERLDFAAINNVYGQSSLISSGRVDRVPGTNDANLTTILWQFKPDVANSLTFIVGSSSGSASSGSSGGTSGGSAGSSDSISNGSSSWGSVTSTLTFVTSE